MSDTTPNAIADAMTAALAGIAGEAKRDIISGDEVSFHHDGRNDIVIPQGMTYSKAGRIFARMQEEAETVIENKRTYDYRPYDGAVAVMNVMKRLFGITIGAGTQSFFGSTPPETRTVKTGVHASVEVPWGRVIIPALDRTEVQIAGVLHSELGAITYVSIESPKKNKAICTEFLDAIEVELRNNSIYRGKCIVGTEEPEFLDLSTVKPEEIVFSEQVMTTLEGSLWTVIRHREALKGEGVRIKRALLAEGPYGTGKTSAGLLTALEAEKAGWTFIAARPGKDDIKEVLKTAQLYQPAVVFIEDVDNAASVGDSDQVSQLLETFDGVTSKGAELCLLMTTNNIERVHKGMLRPGRIDAVVTVAELDRPGVEKLVRAVVPANRLDAGVDFDEVFEAMQVEVRGERVAFLPAYVREAVERAKTYAIGRLNGGVGYELCTTDLVGAAMSLHDQLLLQHEAKEGEKPTGLDAEFKRMMADQLGNVEVLDYDGDREGSLRVRK